MKELGYSQSVEDFQKSLPQLGIQYNGSIDGIVNPQFVSAMLALEMKVEIDTRIPAIDKIFSGGRVLMPLQKVVEIYFSKHNEDSASPPAPSGLAGNPSIQSWQAALSQPIPLVGQVYHGAIDGIANPELSAAAKKIEDTIQSRLTNGSVVGKVWDGGKFLTTPDDVIHALQLLT